jgi:hypothetical protein
MGKDEIEWLVLHQANLRILTSAADRLGVPQGECRRRACICFVAFLCLARTRVTGAYVGVGWTIKATVAV